MSPPSERARRWMAEGTALVTKACGTLAERDADLAATTGLPGWTRAHVLAHLACGAEALGRLTEWARTGVEHRMYASAEQRAADIEAGAALPGDELLARVRTTAAALDAALDALPAAAWAAPVVTAQGRTVPCTEVPWMRARETLVHAVDLDAGVSFADLPTGFCHDLLDEVTARLSASDGPALLLTTPDGGTWTVSGPGTATAVVAPAGDLARWLVGRGAPDPDLPELPRWL